MHIYAELRHPNPDLNSAAHLIEAAAQSKEMLGVQRDVLRDSCSWVCVVMRLRYPS